MTSIHDSTTQPGEDLPFPLNAAPDSSTHDTALRLQRVDEYEQNGARAPDPDATFSSTVIAQLIRVAYALEDSVQQILGRFPSPSLIEAAEPTMTNYLRAIRQIADNVRVELAHESLCGRYRGEEADVRKLER